MTHVIGPCQIEGIIGPEDSDMSAENIAEQFHFWVELRLPEQYQGKLVRVPLLHDAHQIYGTYGNPSSLKGMFCNIRFTGSTISEIQAGEAFIIPDISTVYQDQERADSGCLAMNPLGALDGIFQNMEGWEDVTSLFHPSNAPGSLI